MSSSSSSIFQNSMFASGSRADTVSKYTPAFEPVATREPTAKELDLDKTLQAYIKGNDKMKLESDEEMIRRDAVLAEVKNIFSKWIQYVSMQVLHMPEDEAEDAGGELFISGSHRLGVRDIGADIDTVCVAPNFCTRDHFFTYLKDMFLHHPDVTDLSSVEDAFVPIITFDFRGVNIDLLFARLSENIIPKDIDILDDKILVGLDEATEKSINGPRVTNMIFKLVGEKSFPNFLVVLRLVRFWAKKRGIYGNKLGYLGGINCNILVAFVCQLYPNYCPSVLLFQFFKRYSEWQWPEPIMLNNIQLTIPNIPLSSQKEVWTQTGKQNEVMPIITPAYPAMNSSYSVSPHSMEVMTQEIKRGYEIITSVIKNKGKGWGRIFEPSDFFIKYSHYLACHIVGTGDNSESRSWIGFVESRIRRFTQYPFLETLPVKLPIHLHPRNIVTDKSANAICYFIGFKLDVGRILESKDKNIHIDDCARRFFDSLVDSERGYKGAYVDGLDFYVEHLTWRKLPEEVFDSFGSKEAAKAKRQEMGYAPKTLQRKAGKASVTDADGNAEVPETPVAKIVDSGSGGSSSGDISGSSSEEKSEGNSVDYRVVIKGSNGNSDDKDGGKDIGNGGDCAVVSVEAGSVEAIENNTVLKDTIKQEKASGKGLDENEGSSKKVKFDSRTDSTDISADSDTQIQKKRKLEETLVSIEAKDPSGNGDGQIDIKEESKKRSIEVVPRLFFNQLSTIKKEETVGDNHKPPPFVLPNVTWSLLENK